MKLRDYTYLGATQSLCPECIDMAPLWTGPLSDQSVVAEGRPEVLQLSGGEPTIHPEFLEIFKYACQQPIDIVMINTNGIRFARDPAFLEAVAEFKHRAEIYLQFDTFDDTAYRQ